MSRIPTLAVSPQIRTLISTVLHQTCTSLHIVFMLKDERTHHCVDCGSAHCRIRMSSLLSVSLFLTAITFANTPPPTRDGSLINPAENPQLGQQRLFSLGVSLTSLNLNWRVVIITLANIHFPNTLPGPIRDRTQIFCTQPIKVMGQQSCH